MSSKRPRPYVPLHVKLDVLARQLAQLWRMPQKEFDTTVRVGKNQSDAIAKMLKMLAEFYRCEVKDLRLDHTLALRLRDYNHRRKDIAARYTPNANDPAWLAYLPRVEHDHKTFRRNGAQFSDTVLIKRDRRRENRELGLVRPKKRWLSRPFPKKGRGFEKRP